MLLLGPLWPLRAGAQGVFFRGDCKQDQVLNITDAVTVLSYLFLGSAEPTCLDACDADDSGTLVISDAIHILSFLFLGGPPPRSPFPAEDPDPSPDSLSCLNGKDPPYQLVVVPTELYLYGRGSKQVLQVLARDEEGAIEDVRLSASTRYWSASPEVVLAGLDGTVTAQAPGETIVSVRYRGVTVMIPTRVFPRRGETPRIILEGPREGAVLTSASVDVSGFVTDPKATLLLGGLTIENRAGLFRTIVSLEPGDNRIEIVAVGEGGEGRASVVVKRVSPGSPEAVGPDGEPLPVVDVPAPGEPDVTPPVVSISSPTEGSTLLSGAVEVSGVVDDPAATVCVNGVPAARLGDAYTARLRLPSGDSRIIAEAVDPVGNRGQAEIGVEVDGTLPRLTVTEPQGPFAWVVGTSTFTVQGLVTPPGIQVLVDGASAQVTGASWSAVLSLEEGVHDVVITAVLPGSPARRAQTVRAVFVDLSPPFVEVASPPEGAMTSAEGYRALTPMVRFAGRVIESGLPSDLAGPITVKIAGVSAQVAGGTFVADVPLSAGSNAVDLVATDARGHAVFRRFTLIRESPSGPYLSKVAGDGQSLVAGATGTLDLSVAALGPGGEPQGRLTTTFRIIQGDGFFADGSRMRIATTGADGVASVKLQAGRQAGAGNLVVAAELPLRINSPVGYATTIRPSTGRVLVAHWRRDYRGAGGDSLPYPVEVRLLDEYSNEIAGEQVTFRVVEGGADLAGSQQVMATTNASGVAGVLVRLPGQADTLSLIEATSAGAVPVRFEVRGLVSGPVADTAVSGAVLDTSGQPIEGARVWIEKAGAALEARTDRSGSFLISGAPCGEVLLVASAEAEEQHGGGSPESFVARRIVAIPGRDNRLDAPLRLVRLGAVGNSRSSGDAVSEERGAILAPSALPGLRLDVTKGSATFEGASKSGTIALCSPNLTALVVPSPDDALVEVPFVILPAHVRFAPAARLRAPNLRGMPGATVPLFAYLASAGGFVELPGGIVEEGGARVVLDGPRGVSGAGIFFVAPPGPRGGRTGTLTGTVDIPIPGWREAGQRDASQVVGFNVYAHSGEFFLEETDLELPVPGRDLPYLFRRRYESRHDFRGSLGWNWEHEYEDRRLHPGLAAGNIIRATGLGRFDEYLRDAVTGTFVSPIGVFARLFVDGEGLYVEREPDGTRYRYHPLDGSPASGRLESITDRKENRLRFLRDERGLIREARDPVDRAVTYAHDAEGRIESVTDFSGRKVTFRYGAEGDLAAVTGPAVSGTPTGNNFPEGKTREYRYSSGFENRRLNHNLLEIIDPREVASTRIPRIQVRYDEDASHWTADRVTSQIRGGTNATGVPAGGSVSFDYERFLGAPEELRDIDELESFLQAAVVRTSYTDEEARITEVTSSGAGLPLSVRIYTVEGLRPRDPANLHPPAGTAPPYYETRFAWTREGLLSTRTEPRGNYFAFFYDDEAPVRHARSHLLRLEHHPVPLRSGGPVAPPAVTTYRRDPLFGAVVEETSPRGNHPEYQPPIGGPATPERYTSRRYLDYQEGSDLGGLAADAGMLEQDLASALERAGIQLGLGDLNGDRSTGARQGNVVREVPPPVTLPDGTVDAFGATFAYNRFGQIVARTDETGRVTRFVYHREVDPDGDGTVNSAPGLDTETGGFLSRVVIDVGSDGRPREWIREGYEYDPRGYLSAVTDGNSNTIYHVHNALGQLVETRLSPPLGYRRHYVYDADDHLAQLRIENFTSTDGGAAYLVTKNRWIDTDLEWDLLGRLVTLKREVSEGEVGPARSVVTRYRYRPDGALVRVIHPVPSTDEAWDHDERDLPIRHRRGADTPDEAVITTLRDESGHVAMSVDAADSDGDGVAEVEERRYDGFNRVVAVVDAAGGMRVLERDVEGQVVAESFLGSPGGATPSGRGGEGNVLLSRVAYRYDERGRVYEVRRSWFGSVGVPGSRTLVTRLWWDGAGRLLRQIDRDGGEWRWKYDNAGRLEREESPDRSVRTFTRDGNGNAIRDVTEFLTLDPVHPGVAEDPDYDGTGRFREMTNILRIFDPLNRLTLLVDGAGGVWRARYDSMGNMIYLADPSGTEIGAAADPEIAPILDFLSPQQRVGLNDHGNRRRYAYDNLGRLVEARHELRTGGKGGGSVDVENPFNQDGIIAENYEWDDDGRLAAWTDDAGNRTQVSYDAAGYVQRKTWPDATFETYQRDRDGNLWLFTDSAGTKIQQRFDALHRVVERGIERAAGVEGTSLQRFEHDGLSRPTLCTDDNDPADSSDDSFAVRWYDSLGNVVEEAVDGFATVMGYDLASRLVSLRYPDGRLVETPRDAAGRLEVIRDASGVQATYLHFGSGLLREKQLRPKILLSHLQPDGDGIPRKTGYDAAGETVEHSYYDGEQEIVCGFGYGRDRVGFPLYERPLHAVGGTTVGKGTVWRYDSVYRVFRYLPNVFDPRFPPDDPLEKLVFYPDGNHSWRFVLVNFSERRLTVNSRSAYMTSDEETFGYDACGSLRSAGPLAFSYDGLRRLVKVERGGEVVGRYRYDAWGCEGPEDFLGRGRRVAKEVRLPVRGQPQGIVRHVYSGERLTEERADDGSLLRQYLYGGERSPTVLLVHGGSSSPVAHYLLDDGLGSVSAIVDERGELEERLRYGLHGGPSLMKPSGVSREFSAAGNSLAFAGLYHDFELGFHAVGSRYFDPQLGRFLTEGGRLFPSRPLDLNGYLVPGLPGMVGEVTGTGSLRRSADFLEPFRVRIPTSQEGTPEEIQALLPKVAQEESRCEAPLTGSGAIRPAR